MAHIDNRTGLPHLLFEKQGPQGDALDVLVVRGTFDLPPASTILPAREQTPIVPGDAFAGSLQPHPLRATLAQEGDLVAFKPGTDITLSGPATAPHGSPQTNWHASLRIGPIRKTLRLWGPRHFKRTLFGWKLESAQPVRQIALDDRLAYGGCFDPPGESVTDAFPLFHPDNPAGCGWLPDSAALRELPPRSRKALANQLERLERLPAPQIEYPEYAVTTPDRGRYANFTARPRWAASRHQHQGTLDEIWLRDRYPMPPTDFDPRFYQCAPNDQACRPWLAGDEELSLEGLLPEPCYHARLPGWRILAVARAASGLHTLVFPVLDTVRVDLAQRQLILLWRAHFRREDPVLALTLGATTGPLTASGKAIPELAGAPR